MTPGDVEITVENNSAPQLQVQVQDKAGNVAFHPRLNDVCKVKIKLPVVAVLNHLYAFKTKPQERNTKALWRGFLPSTLSTPRALCWRRG